MGKRTAAEVSADTANTVADTVNNNMAADSTAPLPSPVILKKRLRKKNPYKIATPPEKKNSMRVNGLYPQVCNNNHIAPFTATEPTAGTSSTSSSSAAAKHNSCKLQMLEHLVKYTTSMQRAFTVVPQLKAKEANHHHFATAIVGVDRCQAYMCPKKPRSGTFWISSLPNGFAGPLVPVTPEDRTLPLQPRTPATTMDKATQTDRPMFMHKLKAIQSQLHNLVNVQPF